MTGRENLFEIGPEKRFTASEIDLEYFGPVELLHKAKRLSRGKFVMCRLS